MVIQAFCTAQTSVYLDRKVARNPLLLLHSTVSGNPMGDRAIIKLTDMKRTFLHKPSDLTARHDSPRKEVLFFADPHFLFFNFTAAAHCIHLALLAYAQADPKAKPKECNCQRTINDSIHFKRIFA